MVSAHRLVGVACSAANWATKWFWLCFVGGLRLRLSPCWGLPRVRAEAARETLCPCPSATPVVSGCHNDLHFQQVALAVFTAAPDTIHEWMNYALVIISTIDRQYPKLEALFQPPTSRFPVAFDVALCVHRHSTPPVAVPHLVSTTAWRATTTTSEQQASRL